MNNHKKDKFEANYFEEYYKGAVGDFAKKDLDASINWFWTWLEKLNQFVPVQKGEGRSVLEIGCSIGAVSHLLAERGFKVVASDISKYAVARAKKLTPSARFLTLDIEKGIPLKEKFDLIISFEVVEHLNDPEKGIQNMYKGLKKGGTLVVSTPYPYRWNFNDPTHINVKYPKEWVKIMEKVGFKNVEYHRFSLIPFFYRYNKRFQIAIPFVIPLPNINSPIYFIGEKL